METERGTQNQSPADAAARTVSQQLRIQNPANLRARNGNHAIDVEDIEHHLSFLASDELEGRDTGSSGLRTAARYLATHAARLGLKPIGDDGTFLQKYELQQSQISPESRLVVKGSDGSESAFAFGTQFIAMGSGAPKVEIEGDVVFAGYGISAESEGYDDFADIDVKGKIVMVLRFEPQHDRDDGLFDGREETSHSQIQSKMRAAAQAGAKAVIVVNDAKHSDKPFAETYAQFISFVTRPSLRLPGPARQAGGFLPMIADNAVAEALLAGSGHSVASLQDRIDSTGTPNSFALENVSVSVGMTMDQSMIEVTNVAALLEGADPALRDEVMVYTAHYDHVGVDGDGNIFNGADDDGSGTTAMLEIAEAFATGSMKPKRSVLFLWVSGEEKGLLGSRYYTENPLLPMEKTVANINMDMVGRSRAPDDTSAANAGLCLADSIYVVGGHQSSELKALNEEAAREVGLGIDYGLNDLNHPMRIYYRSDHYNFARKGVPVLFYTTGLHEDYHKITDTVDKIDFAKIRNVARLAYTTGWEVANRETRVAVDNLLDLR